MLVSDSGVYLAVGISVYYFLIIVIHILFAPLQQMAEFVIRGILTLIYFKTVLLVLINLAKYLVSDDDDLSLVTLDL